MANLVQLRMLENLDGFLLVDKPVGIAFSTVVKAVKRKFNLVKVGHGGSLDAMASGLFILLIGDANKYVGEVMGADRGYTGAIRFGRRTDTGCAHGRVTEESGKVPSEAEIDAAFDRQRGDIFQTEPKFAAIRKEGTAEYEVVDTGEHTRFLAHVYRMRRTSLDGAVCGFELSASKQLIARSLTDDIGVELGCGAVLESLRRERVGGFEVGSAMPFDRLLETEMKDFAACVTPLSIALR